MKKFVVAYVNAGDDLIVEFHEATNWKSALLQHSALSEEDCEEMNSLPDTLAGVKHYFHDRDVLIEVIPVPTNQRISL